MMKIVTAGATALFMTVSTLTYAQAPSKDIKEVERLNEADVAAVTDARVNVIKSTLQLTADQEKLWPAVENAIRARARDRQTRLANLQKEADELRGKSRVEILRDRNPIEFLNRRADALTQQTSRSSPKRGSRSIRPSPPIRSGGWPTLRSLRFVI